MLSQGSDGINKMRSDWLRVALLPSEISRSMARSALYGLLGSSGRKRERARARETRKGCSPSRAPVVFLCPLLPSACYAGYCGLNYIASGKDSEIY